MTYGDDLKLISGRLPTNGINDNGYFEAIISEYTSSKNQVDLNSFYLDFEIVGIFEDSTKYPTKIVTSVENISLKELLLNSSRLYIINEENLNLTDSDIIVVNAFQDKRNNIIENNKKSIVPILLFSIIVILISFTLLIYGIIKYLNNFNSLTTYLYLGMKKSTIVLRYLIKAIIPISLVCIFGYLIALAILTINYETLIRFTNLSMKSSLIYWFILIVLIVSILVAYIPLIKFTFSPILKTAKRVK